MWEIYCEGFFYRTFLASPWHRQKNVTFPTQPPTCTEEGGFFLLVFSSVPFNHFISTSTEACVASSRSCRQSAASSPKWKKNTPMAADLSPCRKQPALPPLLCHQRYQPFARTESLRPWGLIWVHEPGIQNTNQLWEPGKELVTVNGIQIRAVRIRESPSLANKRLHSAQELEGERAVGEQRGKH